jgi:putative SOS response-associated peptidase YedK
VIVEGYYEWKELDSDGKKKQPFFIKHQDKDILYFAGLFRETMNEEVFSFL